jgi:hypothetical protein
MRDDVPEVGLRSALSASLVILAGLGCAHAPPGRDPVRRVPLRVAEGVLVSPLAIAVQAQLLREGLVHALAAAGFCLERQGEFEALLHLGADVGADGKAVVTLTIDNGPGSQIDQFSETLAVLPATAGEAEQGVQPLLRDLEHSGPLHDLASSAQLCPGGP